jgi:hypothetical protein
MSSMRSGAGVFAPAAFAGALLFGAGAQALVINIDFGEGDLYSGTAVVDDPGTVWNAVGPAITTDGPLVDSLGNPTPVTITKSGAITGAVTTPVLNPSHVDAAVPVGSAGAFDALTRDAIVSLCCLAQLILNDLPPGEYRIVLYEIRGNAVDMTGFSVDGLESYCCDTSGPDDDATVGFVLSEDYPFFPPVRPDAQGRLFISFGPVSGLNMLGAINGLQLQLIPEPGTAILCVLGLGLLGVRRTAAAVRGDPEA